MLNVALDVIYNDIENDKKRGVLLYGMAIFYLT